MAQFLRPLPALEPRTEAFWRACRAGRLEFTRCVPCNHLIHPSRPICPRCRGRQLDTVVVSGLARLHSYTVNHKVWYPGQPVPYVIGLVELLEQPGLRLMTNIVNCPLEQVQIGMRLRVVFENLSEDVALPLFEPEGATPAASPASV
jgi:uncharacterized OB-fold protein